MYVEVIEKKACVSENIWRMFVLLEYSRKYFDRTKTFAMTPNKKYGNFQLLSATICPQILYF
jgi:hypothetical protein